MRSENPIDRTIHDLKSLRVFERLRTLKQLSEQSKHGDDEHVVTSLDEISWYCEILLTQTIAGAHDDFIVNALFDWINEGDTTPETFVDRLVRDHYKMKLVDA